MEQRNYLVEALNIIEDVGHRYHISFDDDNKYYSILLNTKAFLVDNTIHLDREMRKFYEDYIKSLNIENLQANIDAYFGDEIFDEHHTMKELSDNQLMDYLMDVFRTISLVQKDNLLLAKYGIAIWNTGFHDLARVCRGRVIDTDTMEVVSHPFDKFFNLNEKPDTDEKLVKKKINNAKYIYATEKMDGSTIIVSMYKGKPLITTNGSFENDQTKWAEEMFKKQYSKFLPNMKSNHTYIFEIIHPENKIVLDYGDEKALYLLSIRNLHSDKLLPLDEIHNVANTYGFPYPEVYDFNDLDTMINLAHTMKGVNKEGWVIRIGTENGESMVKLKLDEYFAMHKAFGKITPLWVYKHMTMADLDDYIAICNEFQKASVFECLDEIARVKGKIRDNAIMVANQYLDKYNIQYSEFNEDRDRMIVMVNDILKSKNPFAAHAVSYLKSMDKFETGLEKMMNSKFKAFYKMFEEQEQNIEK